MVIRITVVACFLMFASAFAQVQQTAQEEVLQATRNWLRDVSKGDRAGLNAIMDVRFIATTPAGDVLTKERLVPDDPSLDVQMLPAMDLDGPIVRLYGDIAGSHGTPQVNGRRQPNYEWHLCLQQEQQRLEAHSTPSINAEVGKIVFWSKTTISVAFALSAIVALTGQQRRAELQLPAPTGEYPVGRKSFTWLDVNRSMRPVKVDTWYPAEQSGEPVGRYLANLDAFLKDAATAGAISNQLGPALPALTGGTLLSNAHENARIAHRDRPFALLLFSHGLGISPYNYSIQLEELASHGYVIAAVEHIHDTLGVILPGEGVVPFDVELWTRYGSTPVPKTMKFYEERAMIWAEDSTFRGATVDPAV